MHRFKLSDSVECIVKNYPTLSRIFEEASIDCSENRKSLQEVCSEKGIDHQLFLSSLELAREYEIDIENMSLTQLSDHIEHKHHAYLNLEFPRLDEIIKKVVLAHGEKDSRLYQIRELFLALRDDLLAHMMKEEQILFPMIRQLEESQKSQITPSFHCGSISNPITQMEAEHTQADLLLEKLRKLTDNYTSPTWACRTYVAMLNGLENFEDDLHLHIHKESDVLFPRVIKMEQAL